MIYMMIYFDIELVGFCDAINIKGVKCFFFFLGTSNGRTKLFLKKCFKTRFKYKFYKIDF